MAHYDASKYGLNALTKASALEYAQFGITVNAIAPGAVKTPGSLKVRSELGGGSVEAGKYSILLRAKFQSLERTLREEEVAEWSAQIVSALHGLGGTKISFLPTLAALAPERRVIAVDLPGFGDSDKPLASYDAAFSARWVEALLDALDIDRIIERKPQVCLIDELAVGNRWLDVGELLANGINVMTALNLVLNIVFIRGLGPIPAFGTAGAAIGTSIATGTVGSFGR